jgi:mevalonate kinase|nr:mevalonate kinase [Brevibacterium sp. 68QC2CO]
MQAEGRAVPADPSAAPPAATGFTGSDPARTSVLQGDLLHFPARGRAHAKAILFGEHAVNYGAPAIAIPVRALAATASITSREPGAGLALECELYTGEAKDAPERLAPVLTALRIAGKRLAPNTASRHVSVLDADMTLRIDSSVPYERGLGSSAAVGAAIVRAFMDLTETSEDSLDRPEFLEIIRQAECVAHGSSSGLDPNTVVSEGPISFQNRVASPLRVGRPLTFVLADSGVPGSTSTAVAQVRARHDADPSFFDKTLGALTEHAYAAAGDLGQGNDVRLGTRMTRVHSLLAGLGISTPGLDTLVGCAQDAGALGAKLTGGGRGGCIVALAAGDTDAAQDDSARTIETALLRAGAARTWKTTVNAI